jgi:hypothetical protein
VSRDPIESVRAQLARDAAMRAVVTAILDRCDRRGELPKRLTLRCRTREEHEALGRLLSAAAVRPTGDGDLALRLDLARADARLRLEGGPGLAEVLYAASGRTPRNLHAEASTLAERAASAALALARLRHGAAAAVLRAQAVRLAECSCLHAQREWRASKRSST